jgi:anthranilate/para-aminobenzoate synthase component II
MHGRLSRIRHKGEGVFRGLPDAFQVRLRHTALGRAFAEPLEVWYWARGANTCRCIGQLVARG